MGWIKFPLFTVLEVHPPPGTIGVTHSKFYHDVVRLIIEELLSLRSFIRLTETTLRIHEVN